MKTLVISMLLSVFVVSNLVLATDKAPAGTPATGQTFIDPTTGVEFILVKGGCYKMGSDAGADDETPVHEVCVSDFYLGKYELTQGQWEKVMKKNPSHYDKCGADCPVESISWDESQMFLKKLSSLSKKMYRLPTEAEWEFAARSGGRDEKFAGIDDENVLGEFAWFDKNSNMTVHPVGKKKSNGLGFYDMTGNVDEWCQDRYDEAYYKNSPKKNPTGPGAGAERASRGGGYDTTAWRARVAHRSKFDTGSRERNIGLRLLLPIN